MILYPHNYAEILSALICTVCLLIRPSFTNRWFTIFLWSTVCIELAGKLLRHHPTYKMVMYNVFGVVECIFYLLYLSQINNYKPLKSLLRVLVVAITSIAIVWWLFIESIKEYSELVSMAGGLFILFASLSTLYNFMYQNSVGSQLKVLMLIIVGLLIFYTGDFLPDASVGSPFSKTNSQTFLRVYRLFNGYLNVFMYSCFAIAFVIEIFNKSSKHQLPS